jgi:hypothetical protein
VTSTARIEIEDLLRELAPQVLGAVERLPAYAPDRNPVQGLWSSLKAVELANLCGPTLVRCSPRPPHHPANPNDPAPGSWFLRHTGLSVA